MKRTLALGIVVAIFASLPNAFAATPKAPKAGATCSKAGSTATNAGKKFTCVKSGKKLVWNKGVKVSVPKPVATPTPSPTPTPTPTPTLPPIRAPWITTLNYYRSAAGLPPAVDDPALSAAAQKHAVYLAKSDPSLFKGIYQNTHTENPASPYASKDGLVNGAGNVGWLRPSSPDSYAIDGWMGAPFHSISIMRENLLRVGFGRALDTKTGFSVLTMSNVAGLQQNQQRTKVIYFPGNGSTTRISQWAGEAPDPREGCGADYKNFNGAAIWASLLQTPAKNISATLKAPDGRTLATGPDLCLIDENNIYTSDPIYGPAARSITAADHLVILIPRNPLIAGSYTATILQNGKSSNTWSFNVITPPVPPNVRVATDGQGVEWDPVNTTSDDPLINYSIIAYDHSWKEIKRIDTNETSYPYFDFGLGTNLSKYIFCLTTNLTYFLLDQTKGCHYGPLSARDPKILLPNPLKVWYPWVGNFAFVGDTVSLNTDQWAKLSVTTSTPDACTVNNSDSVQPAIIGLSASACNLHITSLTIRGYMDVNQDLTILFKAKTP